MKKNLLFCLFIFAGTSVFAQYDDWMNQVMVENQTGKDILYLFFSPSDTSLWGPDLLGSSVVLSDGSSLEFDLFYPEIDAFFDCQAVDEEGNIYEVFRFHISDGQSGFLSLSSSDKASQVDMGDFVDNLISFTVENGCSEDFKYLFISPNDSMAYGANYLIDSPRFERYTERTVYIPDPGSGLVYDVMAVNDFDSTYSFSVELEPGNNDQWVDIVPEDLDEEY